MTAGVAPEPIIQNGLVLVRANICADQLPIHGGIGKPSNDILGRIGEIGLASREKIRSRLSVKVLHAIRDQPG